MVGVPKNICKANFIDRFDKDDQIQLRKQCVMYMEASEKTEPQNVYKNQIPFRKTILEKNPYNLK